MACQAPCKSSPLHSQNDCRPFVSSGKLCSIQCETQGAMPCTVRSTLLAPATYRHFTCLILICSMNQGSDKHEWQSAQRHACEHLKKCCLPALTHRADRDIVKSQVRFAEPQLSCSKIIPFHDDSQRAGTSRYTLHVILFSFFSSLKTVEASCRHVPPSLPRGWQVLATLHSSQHSIVRCQH